MPRKGTLTDEQTLGMAEDGMSIIALCVHEGMSPYGIYGRIYRARRVSRTKALRARRQARKVPQPTITSFESLNRAVEDLRRQLELHG